MSNIKLTQFIPSKLCLNCDVCCRFLDKNSPLAPLFLPNEITLRIKPYLSKSNRVKLKYFPAINACACPFFNIANNKCRIYPKRPFDCRLYPFILMFDEKKERIILGIDTKCPFAIDKKNEPLIKKRSGELINLLEKKVVTSLMASNPLFIGNFQGDVIKLCVLNTLTKTLIDNPIKNGFKKLSLDDKPIFDKYLKKIKNPLSIQSFINLFIWQNLNQIWWKKANKLNLLLETDSAYIDFDSIKKFPDYIYLTKDLIELKGNKYKHKRSAYNYFSKHYKFQYVTYKPAMKTQCLKLFSKWATRRKKKFNDPYYHQLLNDSFIAHKTTMENYRKLGLTGRVIKIKKKASGYTFGFELTKDMFCILFEVCDLKFKGISEFIFREFCKELSQYKYINTMDDSGLENLRQAKLLYRPIKNN